MDINTLIVTVNGNAKNLVEKMNIQTNCIVSNQCKKNSYEEFFYNDKVCKHSMIDSIGVGANRNNCIEKCTSDIAILADDDMFFFDGYQEMIQKAYVDNPQIDLIIFNIEGRKQYNNEYRVNRFNFMRFGAARISFRVVSIKENNIKFDLDFGGGSKYSFGEDIIFLYDCLKKNLKIKFIPITIARLDEYSKSTWFNGFNEKYFRDKGILFKKLYPVLYRVYCFQDSLRHRNLYKIDFKTSYKWMIKGTKEYE